MKLRDRAIRMLFEGGWLTMGKVEVKIWYEASSHIELGEQMARWLEGDLASRPGYQPYRGPDPETTELIPVLARANRRGYVTYCSQPGRREFIEPRDRWGRRRAEEWPQLWQRAAVSGWATEGTMNRLSYLGRQVGVHVRVSQPRHGNGTSDGQLCVTRLLKPEGGFTDCTWSGLAIGYTDVQRIWSECSPRMVNDLINGWQVSLIDPEWGPSNRLWNILEEL